MSLNPTTEVVGAMLANAVSDEDLQAFRADALGTIESRLNFRLEEGVTMQVAENDASTVNLVLPYYSSVDEAIAAHMPDEDLHDIVGGEIIITAILAPAAILGGIIAPAAFGVGATVAVGAGAIAAGATAIGGAVAIGGAGIAIAVEDGQKQKKGGGK